MFWSSAIISVWSCWETLSIECQNNADCNATNSCSQHPFNNIFSEGIIGDFPMLACSKYNTHSFLRQILDTFSRPRLFCPVLSMLEQVISQSQDCNIHHKRQSLQMPTSGLKFPLSLFPLFLLAATEPKYAVISGISKQGILQNLYFLKFSTLDPGLVAGIPYVTGYAFLRFRRCKRKSVWFIDTEFKL